MAYYLRFAPKLKYTHQVQPQVTAGADGYLITWEDRRSDSQGDIYGQRVLTDGVLAGSNLTIAVASAGQSYSALAYNPDDNLYLAVWRDKRVDGYGDIYGQIISASGVLSGSNFVASAYAYLTQDLPRVAYNKAAGQFLVVWRQYQGSNNYDIYGQQVSRQGALLDNPDTPADEADPAISFQITTDGLDQEYPQVAADLTTGNYLVVWRDERNYGSSNYDIYGQLIEATGVLSGSNIAVTTAGNLQQSAAVAALGAEQSFLAAWNDYRSGSGDIYGQPVGPAGDLKGSNQMLVQNVSWITGLAIAGRSSAPEALVTWEWYNEIYAQRYGMLTVDFTATPLTGTAPLTVTFTNSSTNATSYVWDLGDGYTSTLTNPVHVYTLTGHYTVTLTAFAGAEQNTVAKADYITVTSSNVEPVLITTTIRYTYDPLQRLTGASYSGATTYTFAYAYDAMGNTTIATRTITSTVVTSYTYNAVNQIVTAKASDDPITWYYTNDSNGSLTSITPDGVTPGNGARRYTYNSAGYLVRAETHNGTAYQPQAEMVYNSLGQRVTLTAWTGGVSLTTRYVLDLPREAAPLAATANGQTTTYVYGRDPLGEWTNQWTYYLRDGNRTVRQLSDASGSVTLSRSYTPWGELLNQQGSGNMTWGYFGGLLDAATGLIYVGNGQYYDPKTGRFLSPVGKRRNPYLPTSRPDPLSALLGSVVLVAVLAGRRRKGKDKWNGLLLAAMVVLMGIGVGVGLTACELPPPPPPPPPTEPPTTPPPSPPGPTNPPQPPPSRTPTLPPPNKTPKLPTPAPCPTPTPEWLEGNFNITHYTFALESDPIYADSPKVSAQGLPPDKRYREGFLYGDTGIIQQGTGLAESGEYITLDWNHGNPRGGRDDIHFIYGIGGRYANPVAWQTVATGDRRLPAGTKIKMEIYPGRIFTVADTGDAVGERHIDVFVGAVTIAEAYQLDSPTSRVGIVP